MSGDRHPSKPLVNGGLETHPFVMKINHNIQPKKMEIVSELSE